MKTRTYLLSLLCLQVCQEKSPASVHVLSMRQSLRTPRNHADRKSESGGESVLCVSLVTRNWLSELSSFTYFFPLQILEGISTFFSGKPSYAWRKGRKGKVNVVIKICFLPWKEEWTEERCFFVLELNVLGFFCCGVFFLYLLGFIFDTEDCIFVI